MVQAAQDRRRTFPPAARASPIVIPSRSERQAAALTAAGLTGGAGTAGNAIGGTAQVAGGAGEVTV